MPQIKPLSKPLSQLAPEYSVVVIGSGYGAGVAASRLARAGQSVCVLERGRELLPGQYPNSMGSSQGSMQIDTSRGRIGSAYGLFNLHLNDDMLAVVGCGLGGTSLINANVALDIDARLFDLQGLEWPDEFRADKALLEAYTRRAREMLDPKPYPTSFPPLNKLAALEASAKAMQQPFYRPPICVNFVDQINPFGVPQVKCSGCGDCCSGCNDGAKNTTLMNYLPDANNHGASIFTQARVSHVERDGDGWRVHFMAPSSAATAIAATTATDAASASTAPDDAPTTPMSVKARFVMLGAGSLGSTEILLRSQQKGLPLSTRLGQRFSGNGDVLAFGYNNHWQLSDESAKEPAAPQIYKSLYGIGRGDNTLTDAQMPGPCITGIIDLRKGAQRVQDGLVIEEGVVPGAMAMLIPPAAFMADALFGNFLQYGPSQVAARLLEAQAEGKTILNDPSNMTALSYSGAASRTQTYLVMSVDDAAGALRLQDDRLRIDWPGAGQSKVIARDNAFLQQANDAIQGHFIPNPLWTEPQGYKLVTVHPVGGCGMGNDARRGVVNHKGQVFAGADGNQVHAGLYVCDGAVMPGAVGVNPLLTITALAERAVALLAQDQGWTIDYAMKMAQPLPAPLPEPLPDATELSTAAPAPAPAPMPTAAAAPAPASGLAALGDTLASWLQHAEKAVLGEIYGVFSEVALAIEDGAVDVAKTLIKDIIQRYPDLLSPSFEFTETMHGFVSTRSVAKVALPRERISTDFEVATAWGRDQNTTLSFKLRVHTDDLNRLTCDPTHPAEIAGQVTCDALCEQPMTVTRGEFHLLPVDATQVETWRMTYDMLLERPDQPGQPVHFNGFKVLSQKPDSHFWNDVTTLYITLREVVAGQEGLPTGADGPGAVLAQGILTLNLEDLLWQGSSVKITPAHGLLADLVNHFPVARGAIEVVYMGKFAGFFGGTLFQSYGGLLADMNNFPAQPDQRPPARPLKAPQPVLHSLPLAEDFFIKLTRYQGGNLGPVILAPGFTVRASSFAIDTVDCNLVEALCNAGYDVWLFDYRASPDSGSPIKAFTIDDIATIDWPAATQFVLQQTGARDLQVLAHCVGSMTLLMALLKGMTGVRSVISSALTLHPVTNWLSYLKVDSNLVQLLDNMNTFSDGFDIVPGGSQTDEQTDHAIDVVAWNVPVPVGEECKNPVCRRVFSIFGPSYTHAQLNNGTHNALLEMFGPVAIPPFAQLATIIDHGVVVDADGADSYLLPHQIGRLALPISFITGGLNQIFDPETIARTYHWLKSQNGPAHYDQHVFDRYAHMDLFIGRDAARDVFPHLLERLARHPASSP